MKYLTQIWKGIMTEKNRRDFQDYLRAVVVIILSMLGTMLVIKLFLK